MKQQKHGNVGVSSHENVVGMHIDPLREPQAKLRLNLNGTMGKFQKALKLRFPSQLVIELRARPPPLGSWGLLLAAPENLCNIAGLHKRSVSPEDSNSGSCLSQSQTDRSGCPPGVRHPPLKNQNLGLFPFLTLFFHLLSLITLDTDEMDRGSHF